MATVEAYVSVTDALGVVKKIANLENVNGNGDTVETQRTADYVNAFEFLADQAGAGAALTFTFSAPIQLLYVRAVSGSVRLGIGVTPTSTFGAYIGADETFAIPGNLTSCKVFANPGTTVVVWGGRY